MSNTIWAGASAVEAIKITIVPGASGLDLTTPTAVVFKVKDPIGTIKTWSAIIGSAAANSLVALYLFQNGDVDLIGTYHIYPVLTVPGGIARGIPKTFEVVDSFEEA